MVHWIWLIIVALGSASIGGIIMALFATIEREDAPPVAIEVTVTDDRPAEKTAVEFLGEMPEDVIATEFAFPFKWALPLSDLLTQFATALGRQVNCQIPKDEERLRRVWRLNVFGGH